MDDRLLCNPDVEDHRTPLPGFQEPAPASTHFHSIDKVSYKDLSCDTTLVAITGINMAVLWAVPVVIECEGRVRY